MRRIVVLAVSLSLSLTGMAATLMFVSGSGTQFQRRLEKTWSLGRMTFDSPHVISTAKEGWSYDPRVVGFRRLMVTNNRHKKVLRLHDVFWHRIRMFPGRDPVDFQRAEVRFQRGELDLTLRYGSEWDHGAIFGRAPANWPSRIPELVTGRELDLRAQTLLGEYEVGVRLIDPVLRRGEEGLTLHARLHSPETQPLWRLGELNWNRQPGGDWRLRIGIDDADLERFPFRSLRRLFGLPWSLERGFTTGRAYVDWTAGPSDTEVLLRFYRAGVPIRGFGHEASMLRGEVRVDGRHRQSWRVETGIYSHSLLSAELSMRPELDGVRLEGSVSLRQFLDDRGLSAGLPGIWAALWSELPLTGGGEIRADLAGGWPTSLGRLLQRLSIRLEGAGYARHDDTGVSGSITLSRSGDGSWRLEGSTEAGTFRGFGWPASAWTGELTAHRLYLRREARDGGGPRFELTATESELDDGTAGLRFSLVIDDAPLGAFLGREVGDAAKLENLSVDGTWSSSRGVEWTGNMSWGHMVAPVRDWPGRQPRGWLRGYTLLQRWRGQIYVLYLQIKDDEGSWIAQGAVREDGFWDLDSALIDERQDVGPWAISNRIQGASRRYHLEGPLLEWEITEGG